MAALACSLRLATAQPAVTIVENPGSRLRTFEVGTGRRALVLLHGYAATPRDWLAFTDTIRVPGDRRFVFPEGPDATTPPDGPVGGRAWWPLELSSYVPHAGSPADFARARPAGLGRSTARIRRLLDEIDRRLDSSPNDLILGGFSQGAMIAADVAFRTDRPLRALILLSGTPVDESAWMAAMSKRRGLPVFIAHGRRDDTLPFSSAERLEQAMRRAGLLVTWLPFDEGHETPAEVVDGVNRFLASLGDD